jgi:Arc/MetJ-type ribon-helix-helix transcriptional regulator
MPRVSFDVNEQFQQDFEKLVELTNSNSKAEVFRRAIALLKIATEAQAKLVTASM